MAKSAKTAKTHFFCSQCGHEEARWFGRCSACGAWNSAAEAPVAGAAPGATARGARSSRGRWAPGGGARPTARPLAEIDVSDVRRARTGIDELDRVLGGGVVPGSLTLVGGDPGIGKSTLMMQLARRLAGGDGGAGHGLAAAAAQRVLYVSGEESESQVRLRADRLGAIPAGLLLLCESDVEAVLEAAAEVKPAVLIADSVQTLSRADLEGGPGTVTQVRESALALMHFAKATGTAVFLVGHVTKDGAVAGPRVLEHMVDAVLYLEGERYQHYRVLRAAKNRFGATHELGVFEMTGEGLREIGNPSEAFLASLAPGPASSGAPGGDPATLAPGSAVVASLEGSRPLLVEVQALVSSSFYATPQRVASGFDPRRLAVLLAVLERRVGLRLGRHDVFVTATGGIRLEEPGTDLGVALALASSFRSRPLLPRTLAVGEVSLSGELRRVTRLETRLHEAARLGFTRAGIPATQADEAKGAKLEVVPLATLREAFETLLGEAVKVAESRRPGHIAERLREEAGH